MISVKLDQHVRECDHCNVKNIKRTFHIQINGLELYIGRVCIGNILNIDTSGNPYKARDRVRNKLLLIGEENAENMLEEYSN